jgi:hypothetical protein
MPVHIPKLLGSDTELANFVLGVESPSGTGATASRLLLRQMRQPPMELPDDKREIPGFTMGEWGRRFLPANGASVYIDCHHLELNTPETLRATDYVAAWHAMLRIADQARRKAARRG